MIVDRKVFVPMRDDVRVALTTYRPEGAGRFPVVVESVPYRKDDDCYARDWQNYLYLADRGIAGVRIDIRGTGASEGVITDEYTAAEMADTVEVLHWAAEQPWSNGNIGMWGISWGGFSSLQAAMLRPEPLQAIMPMHATHDRFATDIHYAGGSVMAAEQGDWPASMIGLNALPPDPEIVGDRWREMWMQRLDQTPQWIFEWFRHQRRDDYWRHGSPCADYGSIAVPTLLIGGWLDGYVDGMLAMLKKLTCPRRAVIGPWGHYRPATGVPEPTFDHLDLMARWFGHHLRGDDNGVMDMPELTSWVRTEPPYDGAVTKGYWRGDRIWSEGRKWLLPLPGSEPRVWRGPQWVGSHAPAWDRAGTPSTDSGPDDAESVVFESEPFAQPLSFLGQPLVRLMVNSDQPFGMVAVRLSAVSPSAEAHLISRGSRNLAFPDDLADPHAVIEGEWRLVEVPLLAAAVSIPVGWRLRLAIAGADFPIIWPPARQFSLAIDPERSSAVLPLLPEGGEILDIPPSPPPPPAPVAIDEDTFDFKVERNGGTATFRRNVAHREGQPSGLVYESQQRSLTAVEDGDPASMAVSSMGSIRLTRGEWQVGATYALEIATSPKSFQIEISLQTQESGTEVFSRAWSESIAREWGVTTESPLAGLRSAWHDLYEGEHQEELEALLDALERVKQARTLLPLSADWYKDVVVYSLYVDLFNGTFEGVTAKLDYLQELGITCLWLLPVLESPMKDAGFDISDYTKVREDLADGPNPDEIFDQFVDEAHRRGIAIIFDIAVNHSSITHSWFQESKDNKDSPYRDYYIWSDSDELYSEARVIFKGMMDSNWTRCGDQFYFHRFFDIQPDLNYRNPKVLVEMAMILLGWLARGIDGFRADAVPYLWKEAGTNCENLPKTHTVVKVLRAALDYARPGVLLLAEANQPPQEVARYFGEGDECNGAYHFPLMPRMYRALAEGDGQSIKYTLSPESTPPIPSNCQWFTFLRCHDELTLEMVSPDERQLIHDFYVTDPRLDFREGEGISARLAPLLGNDPRRINLMNSILLTLIGTPIIYYGDEVAKGNDHAYHDMRVAETGYPDSRHLARGPISWAEVDAALAEPQSLASQVFYPLQRMIAFRREHAAFGRGTLEFLDVGDDRVLAYARTFGPQRIELVANLVDAPLRVVLAERTFTLEPFGFDLHTILA